MLHPQVFQQAVEPAGKLVPAKRFAGGIMLQFKHGTHVLLYCQFAKNRGFLRQVTKPQPRAFVNRHLFD